MMLYNGCGGSVLLINITSSLIICAAHKATDEAADAAKYEKASTVAWWGMVIIWVYSCITISSIIIVLAVSHAAIDNNDNTRGICVIIDWNISTERKA